jgi:hypothetical protein
LYSPERVCRWARLQTFQSVALTFIEREGSLLLREQEAERELERALGKKAKEVEILQAAWGELRKRPSYYGVYKK